MHYRASFHIIFSSGRLWNAEHVVKNRRTDGEDAAICPELGVSCLDNDSSVVEPWI